MKKRMDNKKVVINNHYYINGSKINVALAGEKSKSGIKRFVVLLAVLFALLALFKLDPELLAEIVHALIDFSKLLG